ncbi:hypothetical protein M405DRAFT_837850 [Rhizopogon salebrosus TDB-379]|nr:hypothetical protein M405DRAFT_837850 [Rhizopogon salebrosus TDB-379]
MRKVEVEPLISHRKKMKKVEFQLWSHDQGWGGEPEHHGTYTGYYTWFDVGIEKSHVLTFANNIVQWPAYLMLMESRFMSKGTPFLPPDNTLQTMVAKRETTEHTIVCHFLDSFGKKSVEAKEAGKLRRRKVCAHWEDFIQKVKITNSGSGVNNATFAGYVRSANKKQPDIQIERIEGFKARKEAGKASFMKYGSDIEGQQGREIHHVEQIIKVIANS